MTTNRISIVLIMFCFVALSLSLAGCSKKEEAPVPVPTPAPPAAVTSPVVQQPLSSASTVAPSSTTVDFSTMKDPFKAYVAVTVSKAALKKNRFGQIIPILNYDLTQFSVKGIIIGLKENSALILDPTGKPYVVKAGMEIGRNDGRITKITPTYIEVFEQYRDDAGKLKKNTIKLMLPKKE